MVCDYNRGHVTFLHPTTLCEMTKVKLDGISGPLGVCVMSDGNIVVSGHSKKLLVVFNSSTVGVFDIHGTQLHLWDTYDNGVDWFVKVWYLAVDDEDNILMSDNHGKNIIKLDKTCRFLCMWPTQGEPRGLTVAGNIVLVAETGPDCVMAYNLQGGDVRLVLAWDREQGQFGEIMSLSINNNDLTVVGERGLRIYRLTNK